MRHAEVEQLFRDKLQNYSELFELLAALVFSVQRLYSATKLGNRVLTIRREQMMVFETAGLRRFEDQLLQELQQFAPSHCKTMGPDAVLCVIRFGISRAETHGFTQQGPVRLYIQLMFMFGSWFDIDIEHFWAAEVLADKSLPAQMLRADALHISMLGYVERVLGPDRAFAQKALRQIRAMADEPLPEDSAVVRRELPALLARIYPEKCSWLGELRLSAVIDGALRVGSLHSINSSRGLVLVSVLAFMLGHRFDEDPLYPWISSSLSAGRPDRLEAKARIYLEHVLQETKN